MVYDIRGNRNSGRVRHNTLKSVGQALEYPCSSFIGYKWMLVAVFIQRFYPLMVCGMLVKFHFSAAERSKCVLTSFGYETSLSCLSNGHCLNLPTAETRIRQRGKQC